MVSQDAELLKEVWDSVPDALIAVDAEGLVCRMNRQAEILTGYAAADLLGQPVEVLIPPNLRSTHRAQRGVYGDKPVSRRMGSGFSGKLVIKDGTVVPVDISLAPVVTDVGMQTIAAVRDISHLAKIETELRRIVHQQSALAKISTELAKQRLDTHLIVTTVAEALVGDGDDSLADLCGVFFVSPDGKSLRLVALAHRDPKAAESLVHQIGSRNWNIEDPDPLTTAVRTGEPVVTDTPTYGAIVARLNNFHRQPIGSIAALPLVVDGKIIGGIMAARQYSSKPYQASDVDLITNIFSRAALAIGNARLYEQM